MFRKYGFSRSTIEFDTFQKASRFAREKSQKTKTSTRAFRNDDVFVVEYTDNPRDDGLGHCTEFIPRVSSTNISGSDKKIEQPKSEEEHPENVDKMRHAGHLPISVKRKRINPDEWRTCALCHGDGGPTGNCPRCGGTGWETGKPKID